MLLRPLTQSDVGTHVAKCLWFMKYHNTETLPTSTKAKAEFLGKLYTRKLKIRRRERHRS